MHFSSLLSRAILLLASVSSVASAPVDDTVEAKGCTSSSIAVRKEWFVISLDLRLTSHSSITMLTFTNRRALTKAQRLSYINAVKCMMGKPSKTSAYYGGVRSRYDDFQALHIAMTERVHYNVSPSTHHSTTTFLISKYRVPSCLGIVGC